MVSRAIWLALAAISTTADSAMADSFEMKQPTADIPCAINFEGPPILDVSLRQEDDAWTISLGVANNVSGFVNYYGKGGLLDLDQLEQDTAKIQVGSSEIRTNDVMFLDLQRKDLSKKSEAYTWINLPYDVALFISSFGSGQITLGKWATLTLPTDGTKEFAACATEATGYSADNMPDRDFRAELLEEFKDAFDVWAAAAARLDACSYSRGREDQDAVLITASEVFFPGILNHFERKKWVESMDLAKSVANLKGSADALTEGCFGAELLESVSRSVVDRAIEVAGEMDE